jgi:polyhydroxyalkanoate synthase
LGGSGHIAGIINPPEAEKYHFRIAENFTKYAADSFLDLPVTPGSWWPAWATWMASMSGNKVNSDSILKDFKGPDLGLAPGQYVQRHN